MKHKQTDDKLFLFMRCTCTTPQLWDTYQKLILNYCGLHPPPLSSIFESDAMVLFATAVYTTASASSLPPTGVQGVKTAMAWS